MATKNLLDRLDLLQRALTRLQKLERRQPRPNEHDWTTKGTKQREMRIYEKGNLPALYDGEHDPYRDNAYYQAGARF